MRRIRESFLSKGKVKIQEYIWDGYSIHILHLSWESSGWEDGEFWTIWLLDLNNQNILNDFTRTLLKAWSDTHSNYLLEGWSQVLRTPVSENGKTSYNVSVCFDHFLLHEPWPWCHHSVVLNSPAKPSHWGRPPLYTVLYCIVLYCIVLYHST